MNVSYCHIARKGNYEKLKVLIGYGFPVELPGCEGRPLVEAASGKQVKVARLLIDDGDNLHCSNSSGTTALHAAASRGYLKAAMTVLE